MTTSCNNNTIVPACNSALPVCGALEAERPVHFEQFEARSGHVRDALFNLRYRRSESMPAAIAVRAEHFLCTLGQRLEDGESVKYGELETFLLNGARDWKHYAASAHAGAEVCQTQIVKDFQEASEKAANFYFRTMPARGMTSGDYAFLEGLMLERAFQLAVGFLSTRFDQYIETNKVRNVKDAARLTPKNDRIFFAFGRKQFAEALEQSGLAASDVVAAGAGLYGTKEGVEEFLTEMNKRLERLKECHPDALFTYEFGNHECGYTRNHSIALEVTRDTFPDYTPTAELLDYLYHADNEEFTPVIEK